MTEHQIEKVKTLVQQGVPVEQACKQCRVPITIFSSSIQVNQVMELIRTNVKAYSPLHKFLLTV